MKPDFTCWEMKAKMCLAYVYWCNISDSDTVEFYRLCCFWELLLVIISQGLSPMMEEPIPNASSDMSTPLHQLSLGSSSKFTPGLYYDSHRFGMPVRPFGLPTHMEAPVAVPVMSLGNGLLGASTEQSPDGVGLVFGPDAARPMLQQPVAALPSSGGLPPNGPLGISNIPYAFPMWPGPTGQAYGRPTNSPSMNSKLVRPTTSVPTAPVKIDEAKEMSHLSLGLSPPEPSQLTLKLLDPPSRHSSAFQVNSSFNSSSISPSSNAISVVWEKAMRLRYCLGAKISESLKEVVLHLVGEFI
jgi:hypothetical protein